MAEHRDDCPAKGLCSCDYEPLIRADERERAEQSRYVWVPSQREILADLRAKVETLPGMNLSPMNGRTVRWVDLADVLALLDEADR